MLKLSDIIALSTFHQIDDLPTDTEKRKVVEEINGTLIGWDYDTKIIHKKYLTPDRRFLFDIARIYEKNVGYVIAREGVAKDSAYLSFIAVKQDQQKQGIGSLLLQRAIEKAKSVGYQILTLDCKGRNLPFYTQFAAKNGLSCETEDIGYFRSGESKYFVVYELG